MSLEVAFNQARQSLLAINTQIALSGRNIAGADDADHSRVEAETTTTPQNGTRVVSVHRGGDPFLVGRVLEARAVAGGERAIADGLADLQRVVGDPADGGSPAARIGALSAALLDFANAPADAVLGLEVVRHAKEVARSLGEGAGVVTRVRGEADAALAEGASALRSMLSDFETLNERIMTGTAVGRDVTTLLDRRDALVGRIAELVGVQTMTRENGDMALFTDGGVTLFDRTARTIAFDPTPTYAPGTSGGELVIDGVAVTGPDAPMPLGAGRLAGLATLRDEIAPTLERQLDEIARGLIAAFREGANPGLFTWAGGTVPGGATAGVADTIAVDPAFDPDAGGDPLRLRDGNAVLYNPTGDAGFSDRLREQLSRLSEPFPFDPAAGLPGIAGVDRFALDSIGWLETRRQEASAGADYRETLLRRANEALSNARGVNMDDEYAFQMQLERSFAASSKLMGIVDDLFRTLFRDLG